MRHLLIRSIFSAALLATALPACGQREAVKNKAGDASATKTAPPSKTPGGADYTPSKSAGPEGEGPKTAGAGTMLTTDGEQKRAAGVGKGNQDARKDREKTVYDFGLPGPNGKNNSLDQYKGKVLLIVNLGRKSSYASQLAGFARLSTDFKQGGLVIVGVPSNDFGDAEPGTEADVDKSYSEAKLPFLVTERSTLTGIHQLPLYAYLSKEKSVPNNGLHWNYTKFLIDRKGKVILRFGPDVAPDSPEMQAMVQEVVDGTWKPKKEKADRGEEKDDDGQ